MEYISNQKVKDASVQETWCERESKGT